MPVWYRYEDVRYAPPLDEWDEPAGDGRLEVMLYTFRVVKETSKGVRLDTGRFVLKEARKRYACPSEAEARESFIARKTRQIKILRKQLESAEQALARLPPVNRT